MVINLKSIPYYYLTCSHYNYRDTELQKLIKHLGIKAIKIFNTSELPLRQNRISIGHMQSLTTAIKNDRYPFVLMDDDVKLIDTLPETLDIPDDADFIFLGGSTYECGGNKPNLYLEDYNNDFYRLFYMLSMHVTIIPNEKSANLFLDNLNKSFELNEFLDLKLTTQSKELVFLTPKDGPYFYQDNYNDQVTKFKWQNNLHTYLK